MTEQNEGLVGLRKALDDVLAIRAAYHHAEEWERPMLIVKYMDKRVSELEAALAAPAESQAPNCSRCGKPKTTTFVCEPCIDEIGREVTAEIKAESQDTMKHSDYCPVKHKEAAASQGVAGERELSEAIRRGLDKIGITQHITAYEMKKLVAEIVATHPSFAPARDELELLATGMSQHIHIHSKHQGEWKDCVIPPCSTLAALVQPAPAREPR
jgi:hypothetical protein